MITHGSTNGLAKFAMVALIAAFGSILSPKPAAACACCDTYQVVGVEDWDVLNVRSGPSVRYQIVGELPPGTCGLDIVADRGGWLKIRIGNIRGWVSARYVEYR